jgi:hypothetical protein
MAETADNLLKILEIITNSHERLIETLGRMEARQHEHNFALAQAIGENTQALAQILERLDRRIADDSRAMAEILKYVVETTTRTEQMTARILTEVSKGAAH